MDRVTPNSQNRAGFCSSPAQSQMKLKSWYYGPENGGTGRGNQCEALCRADPRCNSWMTKNNRNNPCFLSRDTELEVCNRQNCENNQAHTFGEDSCCTFPTRGSFDAGFGGCTTYAASLPNHQHCATDAMPPFNLLAEDACTECGKCGLPPLLPL